MTTISIVSSWNHDQNVVRFIPSGTVALTGYNPYALPRRGAKYRFYCCFALMGFAFCGCGQPWFAICDEKARSANETVHRSIKLDPMRNTGQYPPRFLNHSSAVLS
jgi:hypothetical protein